MTTSNLLLLGAAGTCSGALNAVAGGGSLVSFPALLVLGYSPVTANVTNAVATFPGYAGGCIGYRAELAGQRQAMRSLGTVGVAGALAGSALLLLTPGATFRAVVPWLLLASAGTLAVQPRVRAALEAQRAGEHSTPGAGLLAAHFAVSVYGGYFAAGLGIMILAVLGMFSSERLHRLNALKGFLSLIVGGVSALFFAVWGPVEWTPAVVLAVFGLAGGFLGVRVARIVPVPILRLSVIALGLIAGITLLTGK